MAAHCSGCDRPLEAGWVACPSCGRPVSGLAPSERLVQMTTKIVAGVLEAGLARAESTARKQHAEDKAAQIALARDLTRDVAPKIADAVTTYMYQQRQLNGKRRSGGTPRIAHG